MNQEPENIQPVSECPAFRSVYREQGIPAETRTHDRLRGAVIKRGLHGAGLGVNVPAQEFVIGFGQ